MKKRYHEKLPRDVRSGQCMALTRDGDRCFKKARREVIVFSESEHEKDGCSKWYRVTLCAEHEAANE